MMRNDDIDDIDLSRHRRSRLPGVLVIGAAIGVALIAAWIFTPILMSKDSAATTSQLSTPKARVPARDQAPALASVQATPVEPAADTTVAADDPASPSVPGAAPAAGPETTAATPRSAAAPWPQSRAIQFAAAPAEADTTRLAAVAPQDTRAGDTRAGDTPAEASENIPLPRRRPSRLIAASLAIPLPRPRPEIDVEAPAGPTTFDLQVERMR
jgi:hypothetical protein